MSSIRCYYTTEEFNEYNADHCGTIYGNQNVSLESITEEIIERYNKTMSYYYAKEGWIGFVIRIVENKEISYLRFNRGEEVTFFGTGIKNKSTLEI